LFERQPHCFARGEQNKFWTLNIFDTIKLMAKKKKKPNEIFDSIRKPIAPPTRKMGDDKPEEKLRPSGRKQKHKKPETIEE
jgi:hypothetical protein